MSFIPRHVANLNKGTIDVMLKQLNLKSIEELVTLCGVKSNYNVSNNELKSYDENTALNHLKKTIDKNTSVTSFLGMGYYDVSTPSPIKRHILQNPQWYTAYTPYQAEISQGRLESQYNYQEMVKDLTGLPIANASLLDEASATGEAMSLSFAYFKKKRDTVIVSDTLHPNTLGVLETRAKNLNIKLNVADLNKLDSIDNLESEYDYERVANVIFQYPDTYGDIIIPRSYLEWAEQNHIHRTAVCDLLSLTKLVTPGELNVNIAVGSSQRFGMPMWYGGPHPAFFATSNDLLRYMPGRIVGKTIDSNGNSAFRLALQTREQHIKRQAATSNICTSQSLLTNVAAFYALYAGEKGLKKISKRVNNKVKHLLNSLKSVEIVNTQFYDTVTIKFDGDINKLISNLENNNLLVRKTGDDLITITISENTPMSEIVRLAQNINKWIKKKEHDYQFKSWPRDTTFDYRKIQLRDENRRKTRFLQDPIYSKFNTETELMRYMYGLSKKDYTLCDGMIPLGSCTMKLNASYQLEPLLWDKISNIHPYTPEKFCIGYRNLIEETGYMLKTLTGFSGISFQPNSGATGEYAGLITIKKHNELNLDNKKKRTKCLVPKSAHGTNTASAAIAGLDIVAFDDSVLDNTEEFKQFVEKHRDNLLCLMITYPNTNGVFRDNIEEINNIIHTYGGYVYMDGANMNALLGFSDLAKLGFDICHLNLHKTFCIPHGGGGPGLGPILCVEKLAKHLPSNNILFESDMDTSCGMVAASPWSSASLITIPNLYISAMGTRGLLEASKMAILNSNYLKSNLEDYFTINDVNKHGFVGHEFIIDVSEFKKYGITENDIAKRLIDYSFHPPTMSWPRSGVLMFEPTESESKDELDRLIEAMKSIRNEIQEVIDNSDVQNDNVINNAPHSLDLITSWDKNYSIEKAFYPVNSLKKNKHFPTVNRVNDLYGDKLLLGK